jgi:hypothetical protein
MRRRPLVLVLALLVPAAAAAAAPTDDPVYVRANVKLARVVPQYPRARLLVEENVGGGIGDVPFEAVERISFLAKPQSQRAVMRFYARRLGPTWKLRGTTCLVSRSRIVVAFVHTGRRRLGLFIDSRGARHCDDLTGLLADLLDAGYPEGSP